MGKSSINTNILRVIEGGKTDTVKPYGALTRKDIQDFLADFAEAIMVDQMRRNKIFRKANHPQSDRGIRQRYHENHIAVIIKIYMTVEKMPMRLLKQLTAMAIAHKPSAVKEPLLNIIGDFAYGAGETATMFFSDLIIAVNLNAKRFSHKGNAKNRMEGWFDYDNPLQCGEDSECGYCNLFASLVKRESLKTKRLLALKGRAAFIEMRVNREIKNYLESRGYLWSSDAREPSVASVFGT